MGQIILASASPRRKELLEQAGLSFEVWPAKGEEVITKETPGEAVMELAEQKAAEVAGMVREYERTHAGLVTPQDILVIGADTVVSAENKILGKPADEEAAYQMLAMLSGKTHEVYTGVAFVFLAASGKAGKHVFYEKTEVSMRGMEPWEIRSYIATGEPMDKAGAYGIQGKFAVYIDKINGDYNNVVGLPLAAVFRELKRLGIDPYLW